MKKIILTAVMLMYAILPTFAGDTNYIQQLTKNTTTKTMHSLDNFKITDISTNFWVNYTNENSKYITGEDNNYYKITFLNENGKKLKKHNLTNTSKDIGNDVIHFDFNNIPSDAVKYQISPRRDYSLIQDKPQVIRNRIENITSMLNSILEDGYYETNKDGTVTYYAEYAKLLHNVLEPGLSNWGNKYNDGYLLDNGTVYIVGFEKVNRNDICPFNPEKPDVDMACGIVTVDINGFNAPNANITRSMVNDRFRFLIYPKKVLLYPSDEYDFFVNSVNNRLISDDLNTEIFNEYWYYSKNLHIDDTSPRLEVVVQNNNNESVEKQLEVRFYDSNNKQIDSWVWNIPAMPNCEYVFEKKIDFSKFDKNIKSYDVTLLKEQKAVNEDNNAETIGIHFLEPRE